MTQSDLKFDAPFKEEVSRLFIFRGLLIFIEMWVLMVWAMWAGIVIWLHMIYMLVLGKRNKEMWNTHMRFLRHVEKWNAYINGLIDKRPDWVSE